jgi:hypothetical protein
MINDDGRMDMKRSQQWITEHFEELVSQYGGKYVGVVGEQVIAFALTPREVMEQAQKLVKGEAVSLLKVPTEEDLVCIL